MFFIRGMVVVVVPAYPNSSRPVSSAYASIEFLRTWYAFELTCVPCTHMINVSGKELGNEIPFY